MPQRFIGRERERRRTTTPIPTMPSSLLDLLSQEQHQSPNPNPNPNLKVDLYFSSSAAVLSIISVLSAHAGRLLSVPSLRDLCLGPTLTPEADAHATITNLRIGIDDVHRLAAASPDRGSARIRFLRTCIRLLSVVADVGCDRRRLSGSTGGVPNEHLAACAHLYLSVVYKIQMKDRASARHLLQVFHDAPYFARKNLLPDLWNHFFLPHLLHIDLWYAKEVEFISEQDVELREQRTKFLVGVYNNQMDVSTSHFALYYKEWIKVDATEAPPIPSISVSPSFVSRSLSQVVFHYVKHEDAEKILKSRTATKEEKCEPRSLIHNGSGLPRRQSPPDQPHQSSKAVSVHRRSYSMRILWCISPCKDSTRHS